MTLRRTALTLVLLLGPTLVGSACSDDQLDAVLAALGEGCLLDSDCDGDLVCVFRRCHAECETTKDCRDRGEQTDCVRGDDAKVCLLVDEAACQVDEVDKGNGVTVPLYLHASCPSDALLCARDGECRNRCDSDGDCVGGASCTVTGVCAEPEDAADAANAINEAGEHGVETATCVFSSECVAPLVCHDNVCREACLDDVDCGEGLVCQLVESPSLGESFGACRALDDDPSVPAECKNGMLDSGESDVDCGGETCAPCQSGSMCGSASDCASQSCSAAGVCQVPSCSDAIANGNETDVDCGGPQCGPCDAGKACTFDGDCAVALKCDLMSSSCVAASCSDGLKNGDESDVDCGGSCPGLCSAGADCSDGGECTSGVCAGGSCQTPTCSDGVLNGGEADIDCGAPASGCGPCGNGAACSQSADCASGSCQANSCTAPSCSDGVQNGFELGIDCGGPACAALNQGCALGNACNVDSDCDQTSPAGCHPTTALCAAKYTLTVSVTGAGSGGVLSNPAGLNCHTGAPSVCSLSLYDGASVTLSGAADPGSSFAGFSGGCSGSPSCMITVNGANVAVTATFP